MRAWLEIQRSTGIDRRELTPRGHYAEASGSCPACGAKPFTVAGCRVPQYHEDAETVLKAGGRCTVCGVEVGYLYATKPVSLFGEDEDSHVLNGRPRVY